MYLNYSQMQDYTNELMSRMREHPAFPINQVNVFLLPDFVSLTNVQAAIQASTTPIWVGAQDVCAYEQGEYSGQVSVATLVQVGCRVVDVTRGSSASKAALCARHGIIPLVVVGEKQSCDANAAAAECWMQLEPVRSAVPPERDLIVAYEPFQTQDPLHICSIVQFLRSRTTAHTRFVYAGSPCVYFDIRDVVDGLFLTNLHDPATFVDAIIQVSHD